MNHLRNPLRPFTFWVSLLVGILAFALYAYTAAPGIVTFFDDSLEFQTIAPTFGIAHPTGYPLYTILGGIWTRLFPIGTWAGRLNLFSAFWAAVTIALLFTITSRLATNKQGQPNIWAGFAAAATYALGPVWWSQATVAEVYALHGTFVAAILATAIGMNQAHNLNRRMTLLMLLFGLGLTHHRTVILMGLPVGIYLLWSVPNIWRPRRIWWQWIAALILPLMLYLYIPLRAAAGVRDLNGSYLQSWDGFWNHVLARAYGSFFADNALATGYTTSDWFDIILLQMGWLALILAIVGMAWLINRQKQLAPAWCLILLTFLVNLTFAMLYRVPDPEVFLLPAILCLAIFSGGGVGLLVRLLPSPAAGLLSALLVVGIVAMPLGRGDSLNLRHNWAVHDQARRMAQANFPPNSQVIGLEGEMTALRYMQVAESLGQAATPINADNPDHRLQLVNELMAQNKPLYLTRELSGIERAYSFSGDADLIRIWPRGQSQVTLPAEEPTANNLPLQLGDGSVQIESYTLRPISGLAQPAQELTLYWRVLSPTDKVLKLSLRLLDATGTPYQWPDGREAIEDRFPLRQVALTPDWQPGELIQDVHTVQLPPTLQQVMAQQLNGNPPLPQGHSATLLVIIYDGATALEEGRIEIMF